MKKYLVIAVLLTSIAGSHCGLIGEIFGKVVDTTHAIKDNVGGVLHQGKNMVFGGSETNGTHTVEKPGLIGTISLKIHDVSQGVRGTVRHVFAMFDNNNENSEGGLLGKVMHKVKKVVFNVRHFLFGTGSTPIKYEHVKLNNDTSILCDKLRKYVLSKNNTGGLKHGGLHQTLFTIQDAIHRLRNNFTKNSNETNHNANNNVDGTGLIDIRTAVNDLNDDTRDPSYGLYPEVSKLGDRVKEQQEIAKESLDNVKQNTNNFIENQRHQVQNSYNRGANKLKGKFDEMKDVGIHFKDETDKVSDGINNALNKVSFV